MTREEAIAILKRGTLFNPTLENKDYPEAFDMAIESLEQELKMLNALDFAISASDGDGNYFVGFRNGLRYAKSLIDRRDPSYESCTVQEST